MLPNVSLFKRLSPIWMTKTIRNVHPLFEMHPEHVTTQRFFNAVTMHSNREDSRLPQECKNTIFLLNRFQFYCTIATSNSFLNELLYARFSVRRVKFLFKILIHSNSVQNRVAGKSHNNFSIHANLLQRTKYTNNIQLSLFGKRIDSPTLNEKQIPKRRNGKTAKSQNSSMHEWASVFNSIVLKRRNKRRKRRSAQ